MVVKSKLFCRACGSEVSVKKTNGFLKYYCPKCKRTVIPEERGVRDDT